MSTNIDFDQCTKGCKLLRLTTSLTCDGFSLRVNLNQLEQLKPKAKKRNLGWEGEI